MGLKLFPSTKTKNKSKSRYYFRMINFMLITVYFYLFNFAWFSISEYILFEYKI